MQLANKYRPEKLSEVVGQDEVVLALNNKTELNDHILFSGPPGSGKTTIAHILANKFNLPIFELNASDERGIDVIRKKIKSLCQPIGKRIIFLDEADNLCLVGNTKIIVGSLENLEIRKLQDLIEGRSIMIPSVNPDTLELENDRGRMVDSGFADFFEVIFSDKSMVRASAKHPFFKIKNRRLSEIKLMNLNVGDSVVEMNNIYNKCSICGKHTFNENTCSIACKNKLHSIRMSDKGNSMYGKDAWNKGRTMDDDERIAKQGVFGKRNGNYNGIFRGKSFWNVATKQQKSDFKKNLRMMRKGKSYREIFGEDRELEERIKRARNVNVERIETNIWIEKQIIKRMSEDRLVCETCGKKLKPKGRSKDALYIHHKDGKHDNHIIENVEFVCPRCHNVAKHSIYERFSKRKPYPYSKKVSVHNGLEIISIKYIGRRKAYNISMVKNRNFILENGVLTHNTNDAQDALRRIMEKTQSVFILTGNNAWKIIPAIQSRCASYEFKPLTPKVILSRLLEICVAEGITIDKDAQSGLLELLEQAGGDMRKAINLLSKTIDKNKNITLATVKSFIKPRVARESFKLALDGRFNEAHRKMEDAYHQSQLNPTYIIKELFESVKEINDEGIKAKLFRELAITESRCKIQADPVSPLIQLVGFLAYAYIVPHLSTECPVLKGGE